MVDWLLKGEPREVQLEALRRSYYGYKLRNNRHDPGVQTYLRNRGPAKGWAHYMQMRLGKTAAFLNEFCLFRRDYDYKWGVVLTPPKFKLDWPLEAERFGVPVSALSFSSTECAEAAKFVQKHPAGGLIAINYEALRYEKNKVIIAEAIGDRTLFGCDESVNIKNPESMYTKAALALGKNAGALRLMSGKPVVHSAYDYWSQLRFIHELDGFNQYAFRNTFCTMGGFQGKQIKHDVKNFKNADRLFEILDRCSWSPRRVDWMDTFGIDYIERPVALPDEQKRLYRQMQEDFLVELANGVVISADQIVGKLLKMQQISSGFLYDEFKKTHWLVTPDKNVKAQEIKAILTEELPDNEKLLVFTCFTPSTDLLFNVLAEFRPRGIRKGMSDSDIIEQKRDFNTLPECRVWISNSKATKYGHTLMGSPECPCTAMAYYENWYSLDDRAQTEERPQGAGQITDLTVFDIICTPHDRAPIRALQRKEDVSALLMRYSRDQGLLPPKPELTSGARA